MGDSTSIIKEEEYIIVDIETTGFSIEHCNIIEIAALKISGGEIADSFHSLIKQTEPIPPFISSLTGITCQELKDADTIDDVLVNFLKFVGRLTLVGHNVSFDYRFLSYNIEKQLNIIIDNKYKDTMRLSKELIYDVPNYKLDTLVKYFNITDNGHHRADKDVLMTYELIKNLSNLNANYRENNYEQIQKSIKNSNKFVNKRISIKSKTKYVNERLLECILNDMGCKVWHALYQSSDILIINDTTYQRFLGQEVFNEIWEPWLNKAKRLTNEGKLEVYSEKQICELLNIEIVERRSSKESWHVSAKNIVATTDDFDESHPLYKKNCVFTGALVRYDRKSAMQYVVNVGGICQNSVTKTTDYLILGDNSFCASIKDDKSTKQKKAEDLIKNDSDIKIISESTFYQLLKNE